MVLQRQPRSPGNSAALEARHNRLTERRAAARIEWSSLLARMVKCSKRGREAEALDFTPYPGALGKRIFESVSKEALGGQWLEHQKVLVNENRLYISGKKARECPLARAP